MPPSAHRRRTRLLAAPSLTRAQLEELDDFLSVAGASVGVQSVAALHGFLTAIALVPLELPGECPLPYVWSDGPDSPASFDNVLQERRLRTYARRMYDDIVETLCVPDRTYATLALSGLPAGSPASESESEDWCRGFLRGMAIGLEHWRSFLTTPTGHRLLLPIVLLGAEFIPSKWRRVLATAPKRAALAACLPAAVEAIATQLSAVESPTTPRPPPEVPTTPEASCSETCACGSGKARFACCRAAPTLH